MSASPYGKLPVVGIWALWGSCFYFFLGYQMIGERGKRNRVRSHLEVIVSGHGMLGLALERGGGGILSLQPKGEVNLYLSRELVSQVH